MIPRWLPSLGLSLLVGLPPVGCSLVAPRLQRPTVAVASVRLTGGNLLQQNFLVTFDIDNPNDRELPVRSLHADLHVGGDIVASGVSTRSFVVPARGSTQFDMAIKANVGLALLKLAANRGAGQGESSGLIDYEMTGGATIDLPFLKDLPFHQHGTLPLSALQ